MFIDLNFFSQVSDVAHGPLVYNMGKGKDTKREYKCSFLLPFIFITFFYDGPIEMQI